MCSRILPILILPATWCNSNMSIWGDTPTAVWLNRRKIKDFVHVYNIYIYTYMIWSCSHVLLYQKYSWPGKITNLAGRIIEQLCVVHTMHCSRSRLLPESWLSTRSLETDKLERGLVTARKGLHRVTVIHLYTDGVAQLHLRNWLSIWFWYKFTYI